jgi:hypothetical protein
VNLKTALLVYFDEQARSPSGFTAYLSPQLNVYKTWITPITRTNSGQVRAIRAPLALLLASNGISFAQLKPNVIKVFPTSMAHIYLNAPIVEPIYPK